MLGLIAYVIAPVPPVAVTTILPLFPPLQVAFVTEGVVTFTTKGGSVTSITDSVVLHEPVIK
jgi:hypothetical protein